MKLQIPCIALAAAAFFLAGCSSEKSATLQPAGLANTRISGELAERIARNFDRLETEYYWPENVYWSEEKSGGWPADKEGRTILALTLDAQASGRTPIYLDTLLKMLPGHLNAKGYLGTIHPGADEQQLSGHGWLLRGLCEYYEWTGDKNVLAYAGTIADSLFVPILPLIKDYPADPASRVSGTGDMSGSTQNTVNGWRLSSDVGCVFIGMDGLIHYYKYDRDPRIKEAIDSLVSLYLSIDLVKIKAQTHASLTALRGLLRYSDITGDSTLLPEVEKRWKLYKDYGMTENFENYNWFERYDTWTEPCAIIDSYLTAVQLWMKTRNPAYLEDAEKIYLNGIASTQRANGGFGCDKPTGVDYHHLAIHADEAYWCCTMRGGEGLGRVAEYSYFTAGDTLFIPFYRESSLELKDRELALTQSTDYPFGSRVEFTLEKAPDREMSLAFFIPSYMNDTLRVNGEKVTANKKDGFAVLTRRFSTGDKIELDYAFTTSWQPLANKDISDTTLRKALYGPLVLGAKTTEPLIVPENTLPPVRIGNRYEFLIEETGDTLKPLYHLMDPSVSLKNKYHREVIAAPAGTNPFARMESLRRTNTLHPDASQNQEKK